MCGGPGPRRLGRRRASVNRGATAHAWCPGPTRTATPPATCTTPRTTSSRSRHPDATTENFSFDSRGNCVGWTDANGTRVINTYDSMDRLVRRDIDPGDGVADDTTIRDLHLRRTWPADQGDQRPAHRRVGLRRTVPGGAAGAGPPGDRRHYDGAGRRTSVGYPSGYRLEFDYEGTDLRRIRDKRGAAVEFESGGTTRFARTPVSSRATWDSAGLPERLVTAAGAATLDERRYRWDDVGQLIGVEVTDARASATSHTPWMRWAGCSPRSQRWPAGRVRNGLRQAIGPWYGSTARMAVTPRTAVTNRYTATPTDRRTYDANGNLLHRHR